MKIFIIGHSNSGKSVFSKQLAEFLGATLIPASEWVRSRFPHFANKSKSDEQVAAMTEFSIHALRRNPTTIVDFIKSKYDLSKLCVIDGIRNPSDFVRLFDSISDFAVFISNKNNLIKPTRFENGIVVIKAYLEYLLENELLDDKNGPRICEYNWEYFSEEERLSGPDPCLSRSLEGSVCGFMNTHHGIKEYKPLPASETVHAEIAPFKCFVKKEFLYNLEEHDKQERNLLPCTAFAVSSYPGSMPSFKILIDGGYVFSYIPAHALVSSSEIKEPQLDLHDLVYQNCKTKEFCVKRFEILNRELRVFFKNFKIWFKGKYILTMDWYMGNELLHLIELQNGQYAFLPSHKVRFASSEEPLPDFKKLCYEWRVKE